MLMQRVASIADCIDSVLRRQTEQTDLPSSEVLSKD